MGELGLRVLVVGLFVVHHVGGMTLILPVAALTLVALVAVAYRFGWTWTGLPGDPERSREPKTLWDWLGLLVVPAGLVIVVFVLNTAQANRDREREQRLAERQAALTDARVKASRLDEYLRQMSDLILSHGLLRSGFDSPARVLGRTLTLAALRQLDGRQKGQVLRFLDEARLIRGLHPRVSLSGADFTDIVAPNLALSANVNLSGAVLRRGNLRGLRLEDYIPPDHEHTALQADFSDVDLTETRLRGAALRLVSFGGADLTRADVRDATLEHDLFDGACITGTTFDGSRLWRVTFGEAVGTAPTFRGATFSETDFGGEATPKAYWHEVVSAPALISRADLSGARGRPASLPVLAAHGSPLNRVRMSDETICKAR